MKRLMILSAAAIAIGAAYPAMAEMATATTDLNVRAGPGTANPVIGTIGAGQSVDVGACTEGWCSVAMSNGEGWVSSKFLAGAGGTHVIISNEQTSAVRTNRPSSDGAGAGFVAGGATGAVAGAIVGGPVGAAVGGVGGAIVGASAGTVLDPPAQVRTYVTTNQMRPVYLDGDIVVGSTLPGTVELREVPDYEYRYVYVNDRPMLVEPGSRKIVYVYN